MPPAAEEEYRTRLIARSATREALSAADRRLAHARLVVFLSGLVIAWLAWQHALSGLWLILPITAFGWLVRRHDAVLRARDLAIRAVGFYERGLARLEDRWAGTGEPGDRFRDDHHVYANDLNLFGRGSLFELLSRARTRSGEATLACWLTAPAQPADLPARQAAVEELAQALDLREELAVCGEHEKVGVDTERLVAWAEAPMSPRRAIGWTVWLLTVATVAASAYLAVASVWWPLLATLATGTVGLRLFRHDLHAMSSMNETGSAADFVADAITHRSRDLDALADLAHRLERTRFTTPRLRVLHGRLLGTGLSASQAIRRLQHVAAMHEWHRNSAVLPSTLFLYAGYAGRDEILQAAVIVAALLLLAHPHIALAVGRWRQRHGHRVRVWVETIAEVEALASLAAYRYEHAADPFPELVLSELGRPVALFDATQLGHPLLPASTTVRNDVQLGRGVSLLVVSGSNMSGKSTLLRTVGINAVMALAGAPVRAASLRLSPLVIGATLRIEDSLQEGRSRFYAEITRIRELADLAAGPIPLLFLLDELFHGTNSHDRLLGAQGVLRSLLERGAVGLITTHDLALTAVATELAPRAVNAHFQDDLEADVLRFDYRLKAGPVTRSNALALMRAVGLAIDQPLAW